MALCDGARASVPARRQQPDPVPPRLPPPPRQKAPARRIVPRRRASVNKTREWREPFPTDDYGAAGSARDVDVARAERLHLARLGLVGVAPHAARVVREQVDRDRRLGGRRADAVDVVARREQRVEVAGPSARRSRSVERVRLAARRSPRPASRGTGRRGPTRGGRASASATPGGTTSENSVSDRSPARNSSHCPMPPPMPLSGAARGTRREPVGSSSSSAKRGRIASHASAGEAAPAIVRGRRRRTRARSACRGRTPAPCRATLDLTRGVVGAF